MSNNAEAKAPALPTATELHLVCGSGGSRAILGSSGAILACHLAGISDWRTLGGASGGSIPTLMLAGGVHPTKIVRYTIETDFSSLLTRRGSMLRILIAYLMKDRYERTRPRRGILSSEKVGAFVESHVAVWPANYWTVAAYKDSQWLFTAEGVFEYGRDGRCRKVSDKPAPVGLAIRASCAVPGIIDAAEWNGNFLFDGALTMDGRCPVRVPKRHFGARSTQVVGLDVGDDTTKQTRWVRRGWKVLCGSNCIPEEVDGDNPAGSDGVLLIKPAPMSFRSLQFTLSADQKWQAVMSGFLGAVPKLESAGLLSGPALEKALAIARSFDDIQRTSENEGELASRTEALLSGHGLY